MKQKSNCTYAELAERSGISFEHLNNIKSGRRNNITLSMLEKLSEYEKRSKLEVLYDIFFLDENDLTDSHSNETLLLLCHLYLKSYAVNWNYSIKHPFLNIKSRFEGYVYKKRDTRSSFVIDSWRTIEKEYIETNGNYDSLKNSESEINFIHSVYMNALSKFYNCSPIQSKKYLILIDNEKIYELVKKFKVKGNSIKIKPILTADIDFKTEIDVIKLIK